jgi:hypothetical protein
LSFPTSTEKLPRLFRETGNLDPVLPFRKPFLSP